MVCLTDDAPFVMSPDGRDALPADTHDDPVTNVDNGRQWGIVPNGDDTGRPAPLVAAVIRWRDGKEPAAGSVAE
jgi:hypothetical protein